jgi:hypothetical protein
MVEIGNGAMRYGAALKGDELIRGQLERTRYEFSKFLRAGGGIASSDTPFVIIQSGCRNRCVARARMALHYVAREVAMSKPVHFDDQIIVRVPTPLREELERAAREDDRSLTQFIRKQWVELATARVIDRTNSGAA